jgi:predicted TIM-barrel fold metal-dependent hydrolase
MTDAHPAKPFDANAWFGAWPFGSGETVPLDKVIADLRDAGIGGAVVSPLRAVLAAEPSGANDGLIQAAAALPQSDFDLRLAPVIDPSQADWEQILTQAIDAAGDGLGGVRIIPAYHAFALDEPRVDALAERTTALGLPLIVQVRMLDERAHHPRMVVPPVPVAAIASLARRHPALRIVASGIFFGEIATIRETPNVAIELSSVESGDTLPDVLALLPPERVLLGTHAPLYVPHAALAKLGGEGIGPETIVAIGGGTARDIFRRQGSGAVP